MGLRFSEGFSEGALRRGSKDGVSRRCPERPLGEYEPLGVHPIHDSLFSPCAVELESLNSICPQR